VQSSLVVSFSNCKAGELGTAIKATVGAMHTCAGWALIIFRALCLTEKMGLKERSDIEHTT
jgi:hypothetical protein